MRYRGRNLCRSSGLVNDRAGIAAVLRVKRAGDDRYFLKRIRIQGDALVLKRTVVHIRAVEQVITLGGMGSVGKNEPKRSEDSMTPGAVFSAEMHRGRVRATA